RGIGRSIERHDVTRVGGRGLEDEPDLEQLVAAKHRSCHALAVFEAREPASQVPLRDAQAIDRYEQVAGIETRALRGAAVEHAQQLDATVTLAAHDTEREHLAVLSARRAAAIVR